MADPATALRKVETWFSEHEFGHLELPNGWFGKPWDNQHQLTFSAARPHRLVLELDEHLLLVFDGPLEVEQSIGEPDSNGWRLSALVFEDFAQFVFDQRWYGHAEWSAKVFTEGSIRLSRHIAPTD